MLTLVTSNHAKYAPFAEVLERLRIKLEVPRGPLPEIQGLNFIEGLEVKARAAAQMFGHPVLVDDAGLVLDAYRPFPGPLTSIVVRTLGTKGLQRLVSGVSDRATMECHLGIWLSERLQTWSGSVQGRLDFSQMPKDPRMILSELFVPDSPKVNSTLLHREAALTAFTKDAFRLHLELGSHPESLPVVCRQDVAFQCPFCVELDADPSSIFARSIAGRLESRIVYEDEHFVVMPPLGEFMAGGLLVLTRTHIPSFAWLELKLFDHLERLLAAIQAAVLQRWGASPLVFEHGPALERSKGVCCVDHAHLNLFPAPVRVQPHLAARMSLPITDLAELRRLQAAEFGYLLVQENDGSRRVYDGQYVPTQLVRRIITQGLGMPNRWHWQDYPGIDELVATYESLNGAIHL